MEDLGKKIQAFRRSVGLRTDEFGALYGVSGRTVESWEQGRRNPGAFVRRDLEKKIRKFQESFDTPTTM